MGFQIKFNWALQIDLQNQIETNKEYNFSKTGNRVFPIKIPIDLINLNRIAIAKIEILEFTNTKNNTSGKYVVLKIYSGEEKKILTNYWEENQSNKIK
ncbi:DUF2584 family protein [Jejuia spongiicola]|uniref:DUF2584 family protein n=1 Tax=Jejuia spongiicola TaxID=2942207 RepID=A0ABT0QB83_9FLAO|nr:DUF2584 family protein [Jejuia spongiicola]MCL6294240.1 DUF2584 family protein [Jejuia spongiicola]